MQEKLTLSGFGVKQLYVGLVNVTFTQRYKMKLAVLSCLCQKQLCLVSPGLWRVDGIPKSYPGIPKSYPG